VARSPRVSVSRVTGGSNGNLDPEPTMARAPNHEGKGFDYRRDLDGLRAVSILAVLGYHAFPSAVSGGFVGVDVFFVISGYLITGMLLKSPPHSAALLWEFYRRRIRRLFPALIAVLIPVLAFGAYALLPEEYERLAQRTAAGALFVGNWAAQAAGDYFAPDARFEPLLHLWSLGVEEQFYLLWPLVLALATRAPVRAPLILGTLVAAGAFTTLAGHDADARAVFYGTHFRLWELAAGGMLAAFELARQSTSTSLAGLPPGRPAPNERRMPVQVRTALATFGLLLISATILCAADTALGSARAQVAAVAGGLLVIAGGTSALPNRALLATRPMVAIGLASYPLYLWHWPVLSFAAILSDPVPIGLTIACLAASALLAWGTMAWVERPLRWGGEPNARTLLLTAAMSGTAALGALIWWNDGLPRRFGPGTYMTEAEITAERQRYWNDDRARPGAPGAPKVVVFGDSQAFDIFAALRNEPGLGVSLYSTPMECSGFDAADAGSESRDRECVTNFKKLLESDALREADVLIYAHHWEPARERPERYAIGASRVRAINPRARLVFYGPKPFLGREWRSVNAIRRNHRTNLGLDEYLRTVAWTPTESVVYAAAQAREAGAEFVDTAGVYCTGGCTFYDTNGYLYFDRNHWTANGARHFHRALHSRGLLPVHVETPGAPRPPMPGTQRGGLPSSDR